MANYYYATASYLLGVKKALELSNDFPIGDSNNAQSILLGDGSAYWVVLLDSFGNRHEIGKSINYNGQGVPYGVTYYDNPTVTPSLSERWAAIKDQSFRAVSLSVIPDNFLTSPLFKVGNIAHTLTGGLTKNYVAFYVTGASAGAAPPFLNYNLSMTNASGVWGCVFSEGSPVAGYSPSGGGSGPTNTDILAAVGELNLMLEELNNMDFTPIVEAINGVKDEIANVVTPLETLSTDFTDFNDTTFPTLISPLETIEADISGVGGMIEKTADIPAKLTALDTDSKETNRQLSLVVSTICRLMSKTSDIPSSLVFDGEDKNADNLLTKQFGATDLAILLTKLDDLFKYEDDKNNLGALSHVLAIFGTGLLKNLGSLAQLLNSLTSISRK